MPDAPVKTNPHIHIVINSARRGCFFAVAAGVLPGAAAALWGQLCDRRSCVRDTVSTATNISNKNARLSGAGMQAAA